MLTLRTNKRGQIALEFLLMAGVSMAIIVVFLIIVLNVSQANTSARTYDDIQDFGNSLQTELLLAAELEDGYMRELEIPVTINGNPYTITIYDSIKYTYMIIKYKEQETFYAIPPLNGTFKTGKTYLYKNGTLYLK
jgi:uncharacterized protein (UPF0333 family)